MTDQLSADDDLHGKHTWQARWGLQKPKKKQGKEKKTSITERIRNAVWKALGQSTDGSDDADRFGSRKIYFNVPLPGDALDENGRPRAHFGTNKIRTAKYTPLSFLPKNLFFQFQNIANDYFLFLVILAFFPIFGVSNPGLNAVPLIVIIFLTAVKDAIEDTRRTLLDNRLNNSPVRRLVKWTNVNVSADSISLWRRVKKASTHTIVFLYRLLSRIWKRSARRDGKSTKAIPPHESVDPRRASVFSNGRISSEGENIALDTLSTPLSSTQREYLQKESGDLRNLTKRTGNAQFHMDAWKNIQVGDFIRVYENEELPADMVVLSTSDPDGICYVETKNLDGETNLKPRHALRCGRKIKHASDCERAEFIIESEGPRPNLYQYSGAIYWDGQKPGSEPITIDNVLLRGCNLRNTAWVLGAVIFTGSDTKIQINAGITPSKRSRIARSLTQNVIYNFGILFIMCLASGLANGFAFGRGNNTIQYFDYTTYKPSTYGVISFWAAVILFQNMVPISLYISLEIIKVLQAYFIYSDVDMYYDKLDYPCTPKAWNISDDLGQVEYIFSDKTGTLTQNVMEFKKATIGGISYGEAFTEAQAGLQKRRGIETDHKKEIEAARSEMLLELKKVHDNPYLRDEDLTFVSPDFVQDLYGKSGEDRQAEIKRFMLALALCHTVISELVPGEPPRIEFKAQSPDEAALVATARDVGFAVVSRTQRGVKLDISGTETEYTILQTLEFNSARKRMSVIVRMPETNTIILFCKGADSVIYSRLGGGQTDMMRSTETHLEAYAQEGLRTLCVAQRVMDEADYHSWNQRYEIAATAIQDREAKLDALYEEVEQGLTLLGGTAIEDRLQDGVPDTIALLADAGIKLWVLTGDKVETAINIGFSCNLLNNDMTVHVFKPAEDQVSFELDRLLGLFGLKGSIEELRLRRPSSNHALVIDGDALILALDDKVRQRFLILCMQCRSVLCCRVSPAQKAAVVELVKNGLDVMTLAIGDGANDVAMIQKADVGVGIAGEEGRQAVLSSDYGIGQFRFLQRLLLVHGRWSYRRVGETIANFFYKNVVWTFAIFWYQIYTNSDETYLFDYTYILLFNLAFTSVPVVLLGVLDQDVSDRVSLAVPQLYRRGIARKEWTQRKFWLYMIDGLYQSVVCFFAPFLLFSPTRSVTTNGNDINDQERFGICVGCAAIFVINFYILLNSYRWDWLLVLVTVISILLIWFWTGVYSAFQSSSYFYKAGAEVFSQPSFWALTALTIVVCLLPRFAIKVIQKTYFPYDVDIIREQVRQGRFADLDIKSEPLSLAESHDSHGNSQPAIEIRAAENSQTDPQRPNTRDSARQTDPLQAQITHASAATDLTQPQFRVEHSVESFL